MFSLWLAPGDDYHGSQSPLFDASIYFLRESFLPLIQYASPTNSPFSSQLLCRPFGSPARISISCERTPLSYQDLNVPTPCSITYSPSKRPSVAQAFVTPCCKPFSKGISAARVPFKCQSFRSPWGRPFCKGISARIAPFGWNKRVTFEFMIRLTFIP
jgi:hypothetical protein